MSEMKSPKRDQMNLPIPQWEFVLMMAAIFGLQALGIDIMLPALEVIGHSFAISNENSQQFVVFAFVLGFGFPQLVFGPISDRFGRKILLQLSLVGYIVFSFLCMFAHSFELLLFYRFMQGITCAGTRVSAGAIIRDLSAGRAMASILSLVYTVFMIVPIIAPALGTLIMLKLPWVWTFGVLGIFASIILVWISFRIPVTLAKEDQRPLSFAAISESFKAVLTHRTSFGYMVASGVMFGCLFAFIGSSEQVFDEVFGRGDRFWLWFAGIASVLAVMNYSNSRVVERFGMRRISHSVVVGFIIFSLTNWLYMHFVGQNFWVFYILFALSFGCFGMIGANFASLAMEPMEKMAGTANAVYGFFTTSVSSLFGIFIAQLFDGTVRPLLLAYIVLGMISLSIVLITEKGKLFGIGEGKT
ncbi:DHA1 family bicyclomycin/chloramphenicol resistance-like MFS transporter [Litorimonas taeanensis]|uniref:DHA1 family bicyclomycin/chloramphenicol resistance-like MFS transporter n=1 Tax=Litorimonas taeanensis TaxID=568099 RepID=A0A420WKB3_9PROT|nr:multidrug effflux MFS transporter [Litorimonas taeanensis]RKQ71463.1 DHA1 family bicyclomycin/chloramphenicol resistance-like MFS transporter [Litorimonas taeanensis]